MEPMTLDQAKNLRYGQTVYHISHKNSDGSPQRWKVTGKVKTWKRDQSRVRIPVKHGQYAYGHITENDLHLVSLTDGK